METLVSKNGKYFPMLSKVDTTGNTLSPDATLELWGQFDQLPETTQDLLTSERLSEKMHFIESEFKLPEDKFCILGSIIREYFISGKDMGWLHQSISQSIGESSADRLTKTVQQHILTIKPEPVKQPEEEKPKALQLPLLDAMGTYPKIGEQVVTGDRITVRGESGPVRGTVRNWLRAYRDALGVRKHTSMERGQFLFQGENTRRLPKDERMRLSTLLKSLDDKTPLDINVERQEIQFPNTEAESESMPTETHSAPPASRPALSTTPQQKLQAFRPVGDRLRIASARSQQESIPSATNTPEETAQQGEELSSAVYGDIASAPASEENGFRFSASHILPHERASKLGIERYRTAPQHTETPSKVPPNTASVGTDTFSPETAPSPKTEKQATSPASRKNFGNLVNLRDS